MKAIRIHEQGGPGVLRYEEVPVPAPGEGEARVKVEAAGVNFIDIYQRTGLYRVGLPFTAGSEAAGVVDAAGSGVTNVKPGDRVAYAMQLGAYAGYAVVPASRLVALPPSINTRTAAAVMLQGMTAHYLTHSTYPLKRGETALVHAAAGGVGLLLVQIAKRLGATVFGTVSTEEKAHLAREAGADQVIRYTDEDFEAAVKQLTGGRGVDVVYDSVGKTTAEKSMNCLRPRGYLVLFGNASGSAPPVDPLTLMAKGSLFLTRPGLAHHASTREELLERSRALFDWIASGELKVRIAATFPLAEAAEAHRQLEGRSVAGKILLLP
jgi:NADPH2:quinone reductase